MNAMEKFWSYCRDFFQKHRTPVMIFEGAFLLRFLHLLNISMHSSFAPRMSDLRYHDMFAMTILNGGGGPVDAPFFRAPLYSYFLALIYRIFGHKYFMAMFVQIILGSASCAMIYYLGKRLFSRPVGILAGILAIFYGIFVYYDADFEVPALEIFLTLIFMISFLNLLEKPTVRKSFWAAVLLGIVTLQRPNGLPYALAIPVIFGIHFFRKESWRRVARYSLVFLVGVFAIPLLVTVRNYSFSQDPVFVAYQGGLNFYLGNNPESNGAVPFMPNVGAAFSFPMIHEIAEVQAGHKMNYSQESAYWFNKGFEFIKTQPRAAAALMMRKFAIFWNGYEVHNNRDVYLFKKNSKILDFLVPGRFFGLYLPFGLVAPIGIMGLLLSLTSWRKYFFLYAFIFTYMMTVIVFFVAGRFRVPIMPYLILFAAYAIYSIYRDIREKRKYADFQLAGIAVLVILMNLPPLGKVVPQPLDKDFPASTAYLNTKQYDKAIAEFTKAIKACPYNPYYLSGLGETYRRMGQLEKAKETFIEGVKRFSFYELFKTHLDSLEKEMNPRRFESKQHVENARRLQFAEKNTEKAEAEFKKAIEIDPQNSMAYALLAVFYEYNDKGERYGDGAQLSKAVEAYRKAIAADSLNAEADYNLAILLDRFQLEPPAEALKYYETYLSLRPEGEFRRFAQYRCDILRRMIKAGVSAGAVDLLKKAVHYATAGQWDEAEKEFLAAQLLGPTGPEAVELMNQYANLKAKNLPGEKKG